MFVIFTDLESDYVIIGEHKMIKMVKISLVSVLCALQLLLYAGCSSSSQISSKENSTPKTSDFKKYSLAPEGQKGIGVGFYKNNGKIDSNYVFYQKSGDVFERNLGIDHRMSDNMTYKLLLFVDFKQEKFYVGNDLTKDFEFQLNPNEHKMIPIKLFPLEKGLHDVFFVIVVAPNIKSLNKDFRRSTISTNLIFKRFNIIVENEKIPEINFTKPFKTESPTKLQGVFYNKDPNHLKLWFTEEVKPGTNLSYYTHIGNKNSSFSNKYAIISLFDWKQVDLDDKGTKVLFSECKNSSKIVLQNNLKIPDIGGIFDFCSILVYNPYEKLNISNREVETLNRVGINIKSNK